MRLSKVIALCLLVFVAVAGWKIGDKLSGDAVAMAVGVLFGVMAGIPTALMVMASNRQGHSQAQESFRMMNERRQDETSRQPAQQTLVIVGSMNFGEVRRHEQEEYKDAPFTAVSQQKALATKPEPLTVEASHEWQDQPYPIVKR